MPLFSIDSDIPLDYVPHQNNFEEWKARMPATDIAAIHEEFDRLITQKLSSGTEIVTSSWLPGELSPGGQHDWEGTPFYKIWEQACRQNWDDTGKCFGLFLWEHMMQRDEDWCFLKADSDDARGTHYFRRHV